MTRSLSTEQLVNSLKVLEYPSRYACFKSYMIDAIDLGVAVGEAGCNRSFTRNNKFICIDTVHLFFLFAGTLPNPL